MSSPNIGGGVTITTEKRRNNQMIIESESALFPISSNSVFLGGDLPKDEHIGKLLIQKFIFRENLVIINKGII